MNDNLLYLTELTLVWATLYALYLFAFRGRRDWRRQRHFLLLTLFCGLVLPLTPRLPEALPAPRLVQGLQSIVASPGPPTIPDPADHVDGLPILALLYLGVTAPYLFFTLLRSARTLLPGAQSEERFRGYRVIRHSRIRGPYAAWGRIYLPTSLPGDLERTALLHEAAHLDRGHHRERPLLALLRCLFWFHPLVWLLYDRLTMLHEFEADAAVVRQLPPKLYGRQLLEASCLQPTVAGLFSSPLRKRITMLQSPTTGRPFPVAYFVLLFVSLAALVVACSDGARLVPNEEVVITLADIQQSDAAPRPPEGNLIEFFYQRMRYPVDLRNAGLSGAVAVDLRVNAAGEVVDIVTRKLAAASEANERNALVVVGYPESEETVTTFSTDTRFSEEVQRVMLDLPSLSPALQEGQPVPAHLHFDVVFTLE